MHHDDLRHLAIGFQKLIAQLDRGGIVDDAVDKRAFAADALARDIARSAIDAGFDRELTPAQRLFLYLPFEHSESVDDQALAVQLIEPLGNEGWTLYARAHQSLIERFGRFPHRNAILGRASTPDEEEALQGPMGAF